MKEALEKLGISKLKARVSTIRVTQNGLRSHTEDNE